MSPIEAGQVVGGKYELIRPLGRGSMGEVWVAHHRTLGEEVAVKLLASARLDGDVADRSTAEARFRFEAQIAARLSRKTRHIVSVTDCGEQGDGIAYLVMELLEGETLEQLLVRGPLPPHEVRQLVAQIARALEEAHGDGVVHRDLKPANVFLAHDEDGLLVAKLLDFGIARAIRTVRVPPVFSSGEGLICGTPGYMSPEQACASKLDSHCDLWALATLAYEALTAELPVPGGSTEELLRNLRARRFVPVHQRNPALPPGLAGFFERAFAPAIEQRFGTASELAEGLGAAMAIVIPRARRPARHREVARARLSLAGLGAALLFVVGVAASAWRTAAVPPAAAAVHPAGSRRIPAADNSPSVLAPEPSSGVEARLAEPVVGSTERGAPPRHESSSRDTFDTRAVAPPTASTPRAPPAQPARRAPMVPSRGSSGAPDARAVIDKSTVL
jgi:tRNA A-37 threonylcarbamoyl transferase component Bud32